MDEQLYFVMDDTYESEHRDEPKPVISEDLYEQMIESAEKILFGDSPNHKVA